GGAGEDAAGAAGREGLAARQLSLPGAGLATRRRADTARPGWRGRGRLRPASEEGAGRGPHLGSGVHQRRDGLHPLASRAEGGRRDGLLRPAEGLVAASRGTDRQGGPRAGEASPHAPLRREIRNPKSEIRKEEPPVLLRISDLLPSDFLLRVVALDVRRPAG